MTLLDYLLGRFEWWRTFRGGTWMFHPFGPLLVDQIRAVRKVKP